MEQVSDSDQTNGGIYLGFDRCGNKELVSSSKAVVPLFKQDGKFHASGTLVHSGNRYEMVTNIHVLISLGNSPLFKAKINGIDREISNPFAKLTDEQRAKIQQVMRDDSSDLHDIFYVSLPETVIPDIKDLAIDLDDSDSEIISGHKYNVFGYPTAIYNYPLNGSTGIIISGEAGSSTHNKKDRKSPKLNISVYNGMSGGLCTDQQHRPVGILSFEDFWKPEGRPVQISLGTTIETFESRENILAKCAQIEITFSSIA